MFKNLKILFDYMSGSKLLYLLAIISVFLASFISFLGPLVLRVTIDSIIGNKQMQLPLQIGNIIQIVGGRSVLFNNLWICSSILVLFSIAEGVFSYLKGRWSAIASESIIKKMRDTSYDHLQKLPYSYHVKAKTGDLIQRCTSDLDTIRQFLAVQFVEVGRVIFMVFVAIFLMASLNKQMTLISMSIMPFIFLFSLSFFIKIKHLFKSSDEAEGEMSTILQENLTGVRVVRAFASQLYEIEKFDKVNSIYKDRTYKLIKGFALYWACTDFLCMSQVLLVIIFGTILAIKGSLTLGTLVAFFSYVGMLLWPVRQFGRILSDMGKTVVALTRIKEILDQPIENFNTGQPKTQINGEIEFKNVSFEYEDGKKVLDNISFKIKQGETIALLGHTGSGKSSLVHLLSALYDYQHGSIKIDGIELNFYNKKWLRQNVGIVLQEPFLFSKTIIENIGMAKRDIANVKIFEAARIASIHDAIEEFEDGYETLVGERGFTLSGGQKQRIAIARILIKECPILIFDDSLSAVDTETDAAIRQALNERSRYVTTIIISHRISTLLGVDCIYVLDNGKIVQAGNHEKLVNEDGIYRKLWGLQNEK